MLDLESNLWSYHSTQKAFVSAVSVVSVETVETAVAVVVFKERVAL